MNRLHARVCMCVSLPLPLPFPILIFYPPLPFPPPSAHPHLPPLSIPSALPSVLSLHPLSLPLSLPLFLPLILLSLSPFSLPHFQPFPPSHQFYTLPTAPLPFDPLPTAPPNLAGPIRPIANLSANLSDFAVSGMTFFCGTQNTQVRGRWACCRDPTSAPPAT